MSREEAIHIAVELVPIHLLGAHDEPRQTGHYLLGALEAECERSRGALHRRDRLGVCDPLGPLLVEYQHAAGEADPERGNEEDRYTPVGAPWSRVGSRDHSAQGTDEYRK